MKGLALEHADDRSPAAADNAVLENCEARVLRTARREATGWRQERRNPPLVGYEGGSYESPRPRRVDGISPPSCLSTSRFSSPKLTCETEGFAWITMSSGGSRWR